MASDGGAGWPAGDTPGDMPGDMPGEGAQIITSTLAEPAIFYDPDTFEPTASNSAPQPSAPASAASLPGDLYASLTANSDDSGTGETLAELATMGTPTTPLRDLHSAAAHEEHQETDPIGDDLWGSLQELPEPEPAASGVRALRSLLLGHGPNYEERLTLAEQRLEQLALYVTAEIQAVRADAGRVTELGRRIDALATRVEDALDLARGGDVSVHALGALQRQLDELRVEQGELEERTQLRQRQARTAQRTELLRLRTRLYAPPDTFGSARVRAIERRAAERARAAGGASDLTGPALYAVRQGDDTGAAWHVFSHGIAVFFGALLTLIVVLARVTGEHLHDAWDHLMALFARD